MVAINFSPRFAPLVEAGTKRQTIRRTARCRPGDRLQLYTGQRTKSCRKLVNPDPTCLMTYPCEILSDGVIVGDLRSRIGIERILSPTPDDFARADGFRDYDDMLAWFRNRYGPGEFVGRVIRW